jgi:hypothetical protein
MKGDTTSPSLGGHKKVGRPRPEVTATLTEKTKTKTVPQPLFEQEAMVTVI